MVPLLIYFLPSVFSHLLIANKKGMENSQDAHEKTEQIPENSEKSEPKNEEPEKVEKRLTLVEVEETKAAPKSRGRPKNSKDTKPRIKRIPIAAPEEEVPKAKVKAKKVVVQEEPEEEEEQEQEEVAASMVPPPSMVEPVPKGPRTLRREHMQSVAAQKRAMAQARQDRFEKVLDGLMGF